jgi:quinol monooxygenase YgiN
MRWIRLSLIAAVAMFAGLTGLARAQTSAQPVVPAQAQTSAPPAAPAQAQPAAGPVYIVTYFEVSPASARKVSGALRQFAAATRKEVGNVELTLLHEAGRPGRFAIVEAWRDKAAAEAHGAAMKALGDRLQPEMASPFETREFVPHSIGEAKASAGGAGAIFVLTHVDVFPPKKEEAAALVKTLAEDSRKDPGGQRFDAVVWDGHPNHFHLIEVWTDRKAREAHVLADHTRQFRVKVTPFEGALYDERLYETVK